MAGDLSEAEALAVAQKAFMPEAAKIFSQEELANTYPLNPFVVIEGKEGDYSRRCWIIDFQTDWGTADQFTDNLVTLDATTGEILNMELSSQVGNG